MITFETIPWWRTLTIPERLALPGGPADVDELRAAERSARWRDLAVFQRTSLSPDEVLAPLGLDDRVLAELLGEPDESLRTRAGLARPEWLARAEGWYRTWAARPAGNDPDHELYNLVAPFVEGAVAELLDRLREAVTEPLLLSTLFAESLVNSLPSASLSSIITPCLVQDMHDQRHHADGLLQEVPDDDAYSAYVALLNEDPTRTRILVDYPLLLRAVVGRLEMWVENRLEFAARLERDLGRIVEELLGGRRPARLTATFDAGDSHRRGQAVAIITTDVGRFVHKPHEPAMETLFDELRDLVTWEAPSRIRTAALVPGEGYFWQEFVDTAEVTVETAPAIAEGLGALTALLHCLRSNDFHHENVVLSAHGPVPIDLESVLHTSQDYRAEDGTTRNVGATALNSSCLGVGILPHPLLVPGAQAKGGAADISVIGYTPGRAGGVRMPHLVGMGTSDMRIEYKQAVFDSEATSTGRELLHGQQAPFLRGFRAAYEAVRSSADALLDRVSHADAASSRYIARPTMVYGKILAESYHPDFMRDALDRHLVLGKLLAHFIGRPHRNALIAAETADMLVGDIPVFSLDLTTGALRASNDTTLVGRMRPPARSLEIFLGSLGREDLRLQEHVIRLSFGCLPASSPRNDPALPPWPSGGGLSDDKLEAAAALIDRLEGLVIGDDGLGTLTLSAPAPFQWIITPGGIDLYSGSTGVGLAALAVAELTGSARAADLAAAALAAAPRFAGLVSNDEEAVHKNVRDLSTGAYGQVSGIALLTAEAHRRSPDPSLREACGSTVRMLGQMGVADRFHDIISGNAGGILAAAATEDVVGHEEVARTVRILADHLLEAAVRDDHGPSWPQADDGTSLLGFSHGATGIAFAFTVAAVLLHDESLLEAAAQALEWEAPRITADGDWPDLRPEAAGDGVMRAWCHGAPGAGYGRALMLATHPGLASPGLHRELRLAAAATQETLDALLTGARDIGNDSLCHGIVGNILCLEAMLEVLADRDEALARTAPYWEHLLRRGGLWRSGARDGVAVPDLMMGVSGMAWGLAFSARPAPRLDLMSLDVR
ncbi:MULTISPECIES: type 2 lanthipeptide synthetase LanM [Actinomyces]|uniref:Type 2 lantipeptide synthetase LanM n=1 Tax=Actinomyces respiraculi TaxID=2744574 RepID=A0A7T0LL07_9ACTO|nr:MULTISPECIES: type 2 lanthipeptide synthetase LanM [Actinomyces]QPL05567.1 type 2 lantipeptide synthetase LanM [Actinomyces respiraculi]